MVWLEVKACIRYVQQTVNLDHWKDLLHFEFLLETSHFGETFDACLIKFDFLVSHNAALRFARPLNGGVVQTLRHASEDLLHFATLVMELVLLHERIE